MELESNAIDFSQPWPHADVILIAEEQQIHANKMVLSMWSPVFQAMFSGRFKEKDTNELELPGKEFESMVELMAVLHPPNKEINHRNVIQLLPLAKEYQIEELHERLEGFILSQASSVEQYILAQQYAMENPPEANAQKVRMASTSSLASQPEFESMDKVVMKKSEKCDGMKEEFRDVRLVLNSHYI